MSDDELGFVDDTPIAKETMLARLVRMETRMVKYQESNAVQMRELMDVVDELSLAMQEVVDLLQEQDVHASS